MTLGDPDLQTFAPAKVNLYLHVGAPDANGMHDLCSLMVFADVGDRISAAPADRLSLSIDGLFGQGLSAAEDNLVLRAAKALAKAAGGAGVPWRLALDKQLPIASGLGGGSSDAGAALRLLRRLQAPQISDADLEAIAASLGSDGAACLFGRPVIAEGRGERLSPAPALPELPAVLVNPGVASPTGPVYRAFDAMGRFSALAPPQLPATFKSASEAAEVFAGLRNDLEAPAIALNPAIGEVIGALQAAPETLLARVSGSGATCFALCGDASAATELAGRLAREHAGWWVRACRLGGPWTQPLLPAR